MAFPLGKSVMYIDAMARLMVPRFVILKMVLFLMESTFAMRWMRLATIDFHVGYY